MEFDVVKKMNNKVDSLSHRPNDALDPFQIVIDTCVDSRCINTAASLTKRRDANYLVHTGLRLVINL